MKQLFYKLQPLLGPFVAKPPKIQQQVCLVVFSFLNRRALMSLFFKKTKFCICRFSEVLTQIKNWVSKSKIRKLQKDQVCKSQFHKLPHLRKACQSSKFFRSANFSCRSLIKIRNPCCYSIHTQKIFSMGHFDQQFTKVGNQLVSSAKPKSENLPSYNNFLICRPSANVVICGFALCRPNILLQFADAICRPNYFLRAQNFRKYVIFLLTNISLKCPHSNLRTTFGFWDRFETDLNGISQSKIYSHRQKKYQRKTNADLDQTHCLFPCKFADLRTGTPRKFADLV